MSDVPPEHDPPDEPPIDLTARPDHHGLGVEHPVEEKPRRNTLRRLVRIGVLMIALLVLLVVLSPMLLSTGPGTRLLVSLVNDRIEGELAIGDLQLSWLGGQRAVGVAYVDTPKGVRVDIADVDAPDLSLLDLLTGSRRLGTITATDVDVLYEQPQKRSRTARQPQATSTADKQPFQLPPTLSGSLVVEDFRMAYSAPGIEPVVLTMPGGTLDMPNLRDIAFDFDAALKHGETTGAATLKGSLLNLFDPDGVIQPMQAAYDVTSVVDGVPTEALDRFVSGMVDGLRPGLIEGLLGEGELVADGVIKGTVSELSAELHYKTPNGIGHLYQERDGDTLIASDRSSAYLDLTPEAFAVVFPDTDLELIETSRIELSTFEMRLPRRGDAFDWQAASAAVELKAASNNNLALRDTDGEIIGVETLRIGGGGKSIAQELRFNATALLTGVDQDGKVAREPVSLELIVRSPLEDELEVEFFSPALPLALADKLGGLDGQLVLWLGGQLEMQAEIEGKLVTNPDGTKRFVRSFILRPGPEGRLTGEVAGEFEPGRYSFGTPAQTPLEGTLAPEAFSSLTAMLSGNPDQPALTIDKPMPVRITLRDGDKPIAITTDTSRPGVEGYFIPDQDQTMLGAQIELSPARVYDPKRGKTYELRGGVISVSSDVRGRELKVQADLRLWVRPDAGEEGLPALLTWQTTVTDLLDSEGGIPLDGATFMQQVALNGGVTLDHAPSGLFDTLLNRDGDVASILGPVVQQMDAQFTYDSGRPTGATLQLNWDEKNNQPLPGAWASMKPAKFDIDADQMLTSRGGADLELEVKVSEEFGNRWMGQLHPILFDAKSGDRPVNIKIDGGSFKFPMNDPAMKGALVEAEVDLGSVEFGENALLGKIMEWAGHGGERAVFEPAKVRLADGRISYDQFDLAVGNVQLRLDGEVDLVDGRIVDMAIRVPGESLIRVFNELDGIIPADDYLNIPMTGPIRRPQFDRDLITQEVTRLLLEGTVRKQEQDLKDKIKEELDIGGDAPGGELIDTAFDLIFGKRQRERTQEPGTDSE